MTTYRVYVSQTVSAVVEVEADSVGEALDTFHEADGMPGSLTVGAFGQVDVDEDGEWQPVLVTDEDGLEVWNERSDHAGRAEDR